MFLLSLDADNGEGERCRAAEAEISSQESGKQFASNHRGKIFLPSP